MLEILLNYGFAWVSVLLALILSFKFITKRLAMKDDKLKVLNRKLSKTHIPLGILLIVAGLVHGLYSSEYILSCNLGTAAWILSILLGINFAIRKLIKSKVSWIVWHRLLTVMFLITIVWHVIDVGGIQIINEIFPEKDTVIYEATLEPSKPPVSEAPETKETPQPEPQEPEVSPEPQSPDTQAPDVSPKPETSKPEQTLEEFNQGMTGVVLEDGTYTGVADAYGTGLTVSATVKNNGVESITITKHNEKQSKYYARPMTEIPQAIIDAQSLDVDTISGATFTSVGIINAVNDALSKALVSGELPKMLSLPQQKKGRG